jgi:hypothetical protein
MNDFDFMILFPDFLSINDLGFDMPSGSLLSYIPHPTISFKEYGPKKRLSILLYAKHSHIHINKHIHHDS